MATKKVNKIEKKADMIIDQAKQIHNTTLKVSDNIVEGSIASGERWQKLMAKALKDGTVIFGKQQDIVLDTLEELKGQYLKGQSRLAKLVGFKAPSIVKSIENVAKPAAAKIKEATAKAKEMSKLTKPAAAKNINATAKKVASKASTAKKADVEKVVAKVTKTKKAIAKKATSKRVAPKAASPKKASPKKRATRKNIIKDDLTKIEGIGPKIEEVLNASSIKTYKKLATLNVKTLRTILEKAGPRYKNYNPRTWRQQANLAAKGNWDTLKQLQKELKGGIRVK